MKTLLPGSVVALIVTSAAMGQSFNVAVGPTLVQPSPAYGAAGVAGYWNAIPAYHNTTTNDIRQLDGTVTNVDVWQYGGTELRSTNDPGTSGNDARLMDYCQVTYTTNLETCLFFYNLQLGEYEVLNYAMMPAEPGVLSYTSCDEEPGQPHHTVGGAWPGQHVEEVTYSRHRAVVTAANGLLRLHSGIVPGEDPAMGAAFNGVQIRKLPPKSPGDMDCNGSVDGADLRGFVDALLMPSAYYSSQPACRIDNADLNDDGQMTAADVEPFVEALVSQ
ncbi:MAG TPA: hypothetical protein VJZ71_21370 [Phycisphaerae bacterium]|nr:hypothetical protein [Phycisphaerae bacterium]